jgi:hypothetical protein
MSYSIKNKILNDFCKIYLLVRELKAVVFQLRREIE